MTTQTRERTDHFNPAVSQTLRGKLLSIAQAVNDDFMGQFIPFHLGGSDEVVTENILANNYTFDEEGNRVDE